MLNCIIIDDEPLAIELLADYVTKTTDLKLVATFTNPIEALHQLESLAVDVIFLDIQMRELTGVQFMKIVKGNYQFILTTAYQEYALESYDFEVVDYLLKPITITRFLSAIERLKKRTTGSNTEIIEGSPARFMFVKTGHKTQKISYEDILYFKGLSDYTAIQLVQEKVLTLEKMKHFEQSLPNQLFIRVHKSYLVPFEKIDSIERNRIYIADEIIPIGATYAASFWEEINKRR